MDENTLTTFFTDQVQALYASAVKSFPAGHPTVAILRRAADQLSGNVNNAFPFERLFGDEEADYQPIIPAGFTEESYAAFRESQETVLLGVIPDDVVGTIIKDNGEVIEVGDAETSFERANQAVLDYEDETEETLETDNLITVKYSRLNEENLSVEAVQGIIDAPQSESLRSFGTLQLVQIRETEKAHEKEAVFAVLEDGAIDLRTLALGVAAYKGVLPFPGLGPVKAVGSVNFL